MHKIIIATHPRTGSTSLQEFFKCLGFGVKYEPFHERVYPTEYINRRNRPHKYLEDTGGMKYMVFRLSDVSNYRIFTHPRYKTIFLYRKNIMRRTISIIMAHKLGNWSGKKQIDTTQSIYIRPTDFQLYFIGYIAEMLKYFKILEYVPVLPVSYEDLYIDNQSQTLDKIFEHTELSTDIITDEAKSIMQYKTHLTPDHYGMIENIEELETQFGSDEYGWALK